MKTVTELAQKIADAELEACCIELTEKIITNSLYEGGETPRSSWRELASMVVRKLRAARRPKPPSLKAQALAALSRADKDALINPLTGEVVALRTILRDLSHMSDEDFNALCPQGHHTPGPEPLSPAAQAVLRAAGDSEPGIYATIVAALRAAADHLGEEMVVIGEGFKGVTRENLSIIHVDELLAIAAELEGRHD